MVRSGSASNLIELSDTGRTVIDPEADVRGRKVVDTNGDEIGSVDELLIDDEEIEVRFLRVGTGGFLGIGEQHLLVPVDAVAKIESDQVRIDRERARLSDAPIYDPGLTDEDRTYYENVYSWWGYEPYWGLGYVYPHYPRY